VWLVESANGIVEDVVCRVASVYRTTRPGILGKTRQAASLRND